MTWRNRSGIDPEQRFSEIEKELGLQNLQDVQIDETALLLFVFTETHKYSIPLTLVS